ncbi:hypothetical protein K1719_007107 [Acacia pycnantha]|nr:hypothetical protein K1719_007107 [Acacia pycnantha]
MRYDDILPRISQVRPQVDEDDPINDALRDAFGFHDNNIIAEVQGVDPDPVFLRNYVAHEFFSLMDEKGCSLYQGCRKYSKLSFLIKLYHIKCLSGITDKGMSMLLELL